MTLRQSPHWNGRREYNHSPEPVNENFLYEDAQWTSLYFIVLPAWLLNLTGCDGTLLAVEEKY